jgi:hypothetical protein
MSLQCRSLPFEGKVQAPRYKNEMNFKDPFFLDSLQGHRKAAETAG